MVAKSEAGCEIRSGVVEESSDDFLDKEELNYY